MKVKPTCFDCVHATISGGFGGSLYEPPEPEYVEECKNFDVNEFILEQYEFDEKIMPTVCGGFTPRMLRHCGNCRKDLSIYPEYSWDIWGWGFERAECCSIECANEYTKKFDEYIKEEYSIITFE